VTYSLPSSSSGKPLAAQTGGPSGAEGDLFTQTVLDSFALSRAAGSPGLGCASPEDDGRLGGMI
jgi:hypothetical protein